MNDERIQRVTPISEETQKKIQRKTAWGLPDNPSAMGMKPDEIKKAFYDAIVGQAISVASEMNRIVSEVNATLKGELFVSYSAYADGTDFTKKWCEGQKYIGVAGGGTPPTEKSGYIWLPFLYEEEWDNKLDKVTSGGDGLRVYAISDSGEQTIASVSDTEKENSLVYRDGNGQSSISTPTEDAHIANKKYVDEELARFDFIKVVDELPDIGLINKIYFVPSQNPQTQDLFEEYIWVNGDWEYVSTKRIEIDLTPYAKSSDVNVLVDRKLSKTTSTDYTNRVYGITPYGEQKIYNLAYGGVKGTIPLRDNNGTFDIGTPIYDKNAANKKYVDDRIGEIKTLFANITGNMSVEESGEGQ